MYYNCQISQEFNCLNENNKTYSHHSCCCTNTSFTENSSCCFSDQSCCSNINHTEYIKVAENKKGIILNLKYEFYLIIIVTGDYVVPISIVVRNRVTSLRSSLKTPFSDSFSANSRTLFKLSSTIIRILEQGRLNYSQVIAE